MATDRITIIRGKPQGAYDWFLCRRGQAVPLDKGTIAGPDEPLPAGLDGKRAGATTIVLPASQAVTRIMKFPLLEREVLAGAIALQVDKFSPFPVEQIVYSYEVLEQTGEEVTVLIVISQRSSVAACGDVLRAAGLQITRVDSAALGMWTALQKQELLDNEKRQSVLLIDEDEVVFLSHDAGRLLSISGLGAPDDFSDPDVCADLAEEISRILMETDAENGLGNSPTLALFVREGDLDTSLLCKVLRELIGIPVVEAESGVFPNMVDGVLQRSLISPQASRAPLNLIPVEWVQDTDSRRFRNRLMTIGGGLLGLWFLLLAGGWGYLVLERARLEQLRERNTEWQRPANAIRSMRLQVSLIDRYRDRTHSALEALREISEMQPQGVDLISFTYRKGDGLEIVGEADTGSLVLQFNQRLNESALFGDVRPGTRTRTRQGRHRFSFDIGFGEVVE